MTNQARVLSVLARAGGHLCDDCLSEQVNFSVRQIAYQVCTLLASRGEIQRARIGVCVLCGRTKQCSWLSSPTEAETVASRTSSVAEKHPVHGQRPHETGERPWFWEGNVQSGLVDWLIHEGWTIGSTADTAAKAPGIDVIAERGGQELWVSVKGYPEKSAPVQAGHWFAGAIFDLVRYRNERSDLQLAIALPDGFTRYRNLVPRCAWLRQTMPFHVYWVHERGTVRRE
jgi:hypothetical protein